MGTGYHFSDVLRTLIIAATFAFLGYLGFSLLWTRVNNPPPQVVTVDSADLEELRHKLDRAHADIAVLGRRHAELEKRQESIVTSSNLEALGLSGATRMEYGTFQVTFTHQDKKQGEKAPKPKWFYEQTVRFENRYVRRPIVLVSDDSVTGSWPHVAVKKITTSEAIIKINLHYAHPGRTATIAYMVIGEIE